MLKRRQESFEHELRWVRGVRALARTNATAGTWSLSSAGKVSQQTERAVCPNEVGRLPKLNHRLIARFDSVRLLRRQDMTRIDGRQVNREQIYIEATLAPFGTWSTVMMTDVRDIGLLLEGWLQEQLAYCTLPEKMDEVNCSVIEFSPTALGYLLHESLGHRLESDDFKKPFEFSSFTPVNFDVWDTPGLKGTPGFCPFDDMGTQGSPVRLLEGKSGRQQLLTAKSGNLRAVHHGWHPIIRQRTLEVHARKTSSVPVAAKIFIDEIGSGTFRNESAYLETSRQYYVDSRGRRVRMPRLQIEVRLDFVCGLNVFGDAHYVHPGGGCDKGSQRGLGISFKSPSAWADLDSNPIEIHALT